MPTLWRKGNFCASCPSNVRNKSLRSLFTTIFVLFSCSSPVFSGPKEEKLYEQCLKPTVCIHAPLEQSAGSAFIVRSEKIGGKYRNVAITAKHCTTFSSYVVRVPVYDRSGRVLEYKIYPTFVYAGDEKKDLAVVLFESDEKMSCAELALDYPIEFGMSVFHIGFGLGDDARLDEGKVTGVNTTIPAAFDGLIRTNVYTIFGDSGGPLFNKQNKVIGVAHGLRLFKGLVLSHHSYYTPISWLKTWDSSINNGISFVYNKQAKQPVMAYAMLKLQQYEMK